jgi:hypothetical protein
VACHDRDGQRCRGGCGGERLPRDRGSVTEYLPGAGARQGTAGAAGSNDYFRSRAQRSVCRSQAGPPRGGSLRPGDISDGCALEHPGPRRRRPGIEEADHPVREHRHKHAPLLLRDAESLPAPPAAIPDGATVRKVSGKDSEVFAAALAAGFGIPEDIARLLAPARFARCTRGFRLAETWTYLTPAP